MKGNSNELIPCDQCQKAIPFNEYQSHQLAHSLSNNNNNNYNNNNPHNINANDKNHKNNKNDKNNKKDKNDANDENDENKIESKESDDSSVCITGFDDTLIDRAYGVCIGAAIGDSIGSYCEFSNHPINKQTLNEAMLMPGGGTWGNQVITGQVTDDTEMAISLSYALCKMKNNTFDLQLIAKQYNKWNESGPFDRGFCTRDVLQFSPNVINMKRKAMSYNLEKKQQYKSEGNLANGSLMRCMPLILYGHKLNENNLYKLMKQDAGLTHANYYIFLINTCYAILVLYLLKCDKNEKNKNIKAYKTMYLWLKKQTKIKGKTKNEIERCNAAKIILNDWLKNVNGKDLKKLQIATKYKGFVKIAFQRTCYHLLKNNTYYDAIKSVVGEGGDTDTNACIVGGVMGALHGLSGIPKQYVQNIQKCVPNRQNRDRFQAKWYFKKKMIETLLKKAPTDDNFNCVPYLVK